MPKCDFKALDGKRVTSFDVTKTPINFIVGPKVGSDTSRTDLITKISCFPKTILFYH